MTSGFSAGLLAEESSPYLLQHADNPVEWYPWGQEALERARAEDKPIFLSIGYSACHWCHVMAHESFEDERVAAIMNQHFVNVKVDREERPDLDQIYMAAVQAMTGSGGWPMSVFLTADGAPFYGGTYFPPQARHGLPSFAEVLLAVADAWQNRRQELVATGRRLVEKVIQESAPPASPEDSPLDPETLSAAFRVIRGLFGRAHGGWGRAPKFPQPMTLEFLLRYHHSTGDALALAMVTQTLEAMARGGIYDQVGGGFHRYSVDERWAMPHFEKMLYDNAQLARVYLHAWQVTGEAFFRIISEEVLDYVVREMTGPAGGFYSSQDADSEGEEGRFYLWTPARVRDALGEAAYAIIEAYRITESGRFEGQNVLRFAGELGHRPELVEARRKLYAAREKRVWPARDEKLLTSWNGLMLAAFAEAARVFGRDDYRRVAERNADFILSEMLGPEGRLLRTWRGGQVKLNGYLEDYAHLIDGLLELYQTTFDPRWFQAAQGLAERMIQHYSAPVGFYDTSDDHETLVTRPRALQDNAIPSGNAMAASVLARLAGLASEPRYRQLAERSLASMQSRMARFPLGFAQWLIASDYVLSHPREIALVGRPEAADTLALLEACASGYRPHQVLAAGLPDQESPPLLLGREQRDGRATAHVCFDSVCQQPVVDPAELETLLNSRA